MQGGERRLRGLAAAPGLAAGPVVIVRQVLLTSRAPGGPADEQAALHNAIAQAVQALTGLVQHARGDAADMLEFQAAMLSDEALAEPAYRAIGGGEPAHLAWAQAMQAEIATYGASTDAHFAARTADLEDMRDRVLRELLPAPTAVPPGGSVLIATDLKLSDFLGMDWGQGGAIVLTQGSPGGHVAMLARARGVPMVVGVGGAPECLTGHALVDGSSGDVILDPAPDSKAAFIGKRARYAAHAATAAPWRNRTAGTADGTSIAVHLNISDEAELDGLDPQCCSGIGLVRTELLFYGAGGLPDEQGQTEAYTRIARWAEGRPVTVRTLDAGGDKVLPGSPMPMEGNPFLGLRGIRLSLQQPDLLRVQLRALARAAAAGAIRILLPMVTLPSELEQVRQMVQDAAEQLSREGFPARVPPLGIMVEVPAAAIAIARFRADFYSIGSNDLTQYVCAAGRDVGSVAALADPLNPAVLELIARVVCHGQQTSCEVCLCGDAAGDPRVLPSLLATGVRSLSVAPPALARAKQAIAAMDLRRHRS